MVVARLIGGGSYRPTKALRASLGVCAYLPDSNNRGISCTFCLPVSMPVFGRYWTPIGLVRKMTMLESNKESKMPRKVNDAKIETRTSRSKLQPSVKPYFRQIEPKLHLGYRRLTSGPGTWVVRRYRGDGAYSLENLRTSDNGLSVADDYSPADGHVVLSFQQAQNRAREAARIGQMGEGAGKLLTVAQALDRYQAALIDRGGDVNNAARVRSHLPDGFAGKIVAALARHDFNAWRDALKKAKLLPASRNRINNALRAALNLAADEDERISNRVWLRPLKGIPDATKARNVILPDKAILAIVAAAYAMGEAFGLLVEVAAVTGARPSQMWRLTIGDLKFDPPRLMMPTSRKGRGKKKFSFQPVPIPDDLAHKLRLAAGNRAASAILLLKPSGEPWAKSEHSRLFSRAIAAAALATNENVTIYALRHSAIVRELLFGVPPRIIAGTHDTSVGQIEKHYSAHITDHSDTITRRAMLDTRHLTPPRARAANLRQLQR
jgi:integrase